MVICLERGADLHMAQLMPLPLTVSCSMQMAPSGLVCKCRSRTWLPKWICTTAATVSVTRSSVDAQCGNRSKPQWLREGCCCWWWWWCRDDCDELASSAVVHLMWVQCLQASVVTHCTCTVISHCRPVTCPTIRWRIYHRHTTHVVTITRQPYGDVSSICQSMPILPKKHQTSKNPQWKLVVKISFSFLLTHSKLFHSHYTRQLVLAGTPNSESENSVGAKFFCPHALADGN